MGDREILSDQEVALLAALVGAIPAIGRWVEGLVTGQPAAIRRVAEILPARSASQAVADELRGGR